MNVKSISSSAMLVELSISIWTARKLDKKVSNDVDTQNSTQTKAGNYHKNLLAGDTELSEIQNMAGVIRSYHMTMTSPWNDAGQRLLTTAVYMEYKAEMARLEQQYWDKVRAFYPAYSQKISAAAFQLGTLFNRDEYPDLEDVKTKFNMHIRYSPVPESGDFRVDIAQEGVDELRAHYEEMSRANIDKVALDAWERLYAQLLQLSNALREPDTANNIKGGRMYASVLDKAKELCQLLKHFNIRGDTQMEEMRTQLEAALGVNTVEDLRKSDFLRSSVKKEVDDILSKF